MTRMSMSTPAHVLTHKCLGKGVPAYFTFGVTIRTFSSFHPSSLFSLSTAGLPAESSSECRVHSKGVALPVLGCIMESSGAAAYNNRIGATMTRLLILQFPHSTKSYTSATISGYRRSSSVKELGTGVY